MLIYFFLGDFCLKTTVAPCVGAWIEIQQSLLFYLSYPVAPCVGAWIEIELFSILGTLSSSHPVWVRGLKFANWFFIIQFLKSHPVWVRGLKLLLGKLGYIL